MQKRWFVCATILILCCSLPSAINTTYGGNLLNLVHPVGAQYPISQPFGPSSDQKLQKLYKSWQYDGHFGIEYAVPVGTDVFACDDGEVFEVNNSNPEHANGLFLRIRHKWGSSVYCHLSRVFVHNGERVSKELNNLNIGSSGKTGFVTGPRLLFCMKISSIPNPGYKNYINPQKYARFATPHVTQPSTSKITRQKKSPEVNKVQKLLSTKKVQRLRTQEVQKLASADRKLHENSQYGGSLLNLVHPVGAQYPISQPFGPSSDQKLQKLYKSWQYDGHFGIDYAVPVGTDVFACDDGEVFEVNNSNPEHPNGLFMRIRHKWGSSVYCHLNRVFVHNGERVSKELNNLNIGSSGKTGFVTGPHLHFGMRISSIPNPGYKDYINPQKYARFATHLVTQPSTSKITRQKKSPEVNKAQKQLSTKKIQQNQIVTKLQKLPGKVTIKAGHPEEAKKIFTIIRKKEAQRLSTQEVQKLTSADRKLPEAAKLPEYSQRTILLRKRIKTYNKKLQNISGVLLRNIPNPPSIEFKLTASEEVNAWADGRITMGLMDFLYSNPTGNLDNQLAMVIAHIIIHEKLETESVNKMLAVGLGKSKATHNDIIDGLSHAFSVVLAPITTPLFSFLVSEISGTAAKGIVNWITEKTLKTFQGNQEDTSHLFSILYLKKAGFDASEGLKIFNSSVAFSRQHPINRQFWEDYAKEVQAKLDHERQLAVRSRTDQKKLHDVKMQKIHNEVQKLPGQKRITKGNKVQRLLSTKKIQQNQMDTKLQKLPGKVTIKDGLIKQKGSFNIYLLLDGRKYLIPDRATLKSLNFEKQGVRALTSSVFNSIPRGNFKELFALIKDGRQLRTQEVQKLTSEDKKLINSELRNLKNQKAGNKVQRLPSTKEFKIPRIYKKTAKNPEKPPTRSNFVIPDVYKRGKGYSSQNMPSSSYIPSSLYRDSLEREIYLGSLKEMEKQYIEALRTTPNRHEGQSFVDQLGSFSPEERKQFETALKLLQSEIRNPRYP